MKRFAIAFVTALLLCCAFAFSSNAQVNAKTVDVTIPEYGVIINGEPVNNAWAEYPCIVYKEITYFPMTYNDSRALGLTADWTAENGLVISKTEAMPCAPDFERGDNKNTNDTATIASGKITINGKAINNSAEEYPILLFRDVTYFPLTWRFAVEEFGWNYRFTNRLGLEIALDAEDMKNPVPDNPAPNACGDNLTWRFDESTRTLYIEGTGDMWDFVACDEYGNFYDDMVLPRRAKTVIIGDGVTSIGDSAFYLCTSLTSIDIPDSVISIGDFAFYSCSLTNVIIPNGVTYIGDAAFGDCISLTSITIPNSVTSIGEYAFYGCISLTSIDIPDSVISIGDFAFYHCSLTNVIIPNGVTYIGDFAFCDCLSLTNVIIPNGVTYIGDSAFRDCISLTSITIPNSVTSIGEYAFGDCISLTSITIPNSVTSIGEYAFESCSCLTSINFLGTKEQWDALGLEPDDINNAKVTFGK